MSGKGSTGAGRVVVGPLPWWPLTRVPQVDRCVTIDVVVSPVLRVCAETGSNARWKHHRVSFLPLVPAVRRPARAARPPVRRWKPGAGKKLGARGSVRPRHSTVVSGANGVPVPWRGDCRERHGAPRGPFRSSPGSAWWGRGTLPEGRVRPSGRRGGRGRAVHAESVGPHPLRVLLSATRPSHAPELLAERRMSVLTENIPEGPLKPAVNQSSSWAKPPALRGTTAPSDRHRA